MARLFVGRLFGGRLFVGRLFGGCLFGGCLFGGCLFGGRRFLWRRGSSARLFLAAGRLPRKRAVYQPSDTPIGNPRCCGVGRRTIASGPTRSLRGSKRRLGRPGCGVGIDWRSGRRRRRLSSRSWKVPRVGAAKRSLCYGSDSSRSRGGICRRCRSRPMCFAATTRGGRVVGKPVAELVAEPGGRAGVVIGEPKRSRWPRRSWSVLRCITSRRIATGSWTICWT